MDEGRTYPPIADYAIIGAMHTCALVSKAGSLGWFCLPAFDDPSVFGRLLDWNRGGYFQIAPVDVQAVQRRYLPNTNALETTFTTGTGTATLTDFMPVPVHDPLETNDGRRMTLPDGVNLVLPSEKRHLPPLDEMFKPLHTLFQQKVVRIFTCTSGSISYRVECLPRFGYGSVVPHAALIEPDHDTSRHMFAQGGGNAASVAARNH